MDTPLALPPVIACHDVPRSRSQPLESRLRAAWLTCSACRTHLVTRSRGEAATAETAAAEPTAATDSGRSGAGDGVGDGGIIKGVAARGRGRCGSGVGVSEH